MRLADMRPGRDNEEIPAEVEAKLMALDTALRGEELPAGMEGLTTLVSDLRADRPEPPPHFSAELDAWAAAGFPRGERPCASGAGGGSGAGARGLWERFGPNGPRGWAPAAAAAATLVVVAVSISQVGDFGGRGMDDAATTEVASTPQEASDGQFGLDESGDAAATKAKPGALGPTTETFDANAQRDIRAAVDSGTALANGSGGRPGISRGQDKRQVERDAQLTLAAPVGDVPNVTNDAIDVVEGANGVVLNSQVTGTDEQARATLELQVPSANLDSVLSQLSDLADVKSRTEQAQDITKSYVSAKDRLVGLRAERKNLAQRIVDADTDEEVAALKAQLAGVNNQIADAKNSLAKVQNRAQFSSLSLVITSDGAQSDSGGEGGWSFGDALGDAGKVLEVSAGVALISAAVLVPLAIIAAIAFMILGAQNRRARERALDE